MGVHSFTDTAFVYTIISKLTFCHASNIRVIIIFLFVNAAINMELCELFLCRANGTKWPYKRKQVTSIGILHFIYKFQIAQQYYAKGCGTRVLCDKKQTNRSHIVTYVCIAYPFAEKSMERCSSCSVHFFLFNCISIGLN